MTEKVYFESDFEIAITLPDSVGDRDFTFEFYTSGHRIVKFYRINGKLSSNLYFDDTGRLTAVFCNHGLRPGKLIGRFRYNNKKDMQSVVRWCSDIELVSNTNVLLDLPELDLIENLPLQDSGGASLEIPVEVTPSSGEANTKTIKTTTLKFRNPIVSYDVENIKMIHPNGVAFLGYGGGTYSINGNTMVINWNFDAVEGEYELRIPNGAFVFENGNSNAVINAKYNVSLAPIEYFTPQLEPTAGYVTIDSIKRTTIVFPTPIESFDGSNVRFAKNFGSVWYDYAAKGTISDNKLSMTIEWDFAPEAGLTYTLELPVGCITLDSGAKNNETKIAYTVIKSVEND